MSVVPYGSKGVLGLGADAIGFESRETVGRVLVVDDNAVNRALLVSLLQRDGHLVRTAANGPEALSLVAAEPPDLILLDVMMPGLNGFETCELLKQEAATRLVPVVLVTALHGSEDKIRGIEAGADDFITKPVNLYELRARVRSLMRIKRYTDELDSAESVIVSLALTIEARDADTEGHCERLATYAVALGESLALPKQDIGALARGGILHDIGKVGIPDVLLLKRGPLTTEEYETMKAHTVIGDRLCGSLRSTSRVRPIVRHHHERINGTGYPDGLSGDAIPLLAQIIGIVDVFDALTTSRPYKQAMSTERACEELEAEVRRGWRRRDLVDAFIALGYRDSESGIARSIPAA